MNGRRLDFDDEEWLDIIAPREDDDDEEAGEVSPDFDGHIQGCQDCFWNPDACDCGRYDDIDE
jgi:hypothetical protein